MFNISINLKNVGLFILFTVALIIFVVPSIVGAEDISTLPCCAADPDLALYCLDEIALINTTKLTEFESGIWFNYLQCQNSNGDYCDQAVCVNGEKTCSKKPVLYWQELVSCCLGCHTESILSVSGVCEDYTVSCSNTPPLGDKDAPITIVEFSDFQCPFCKRFFDDAYPQIKSEYIDKGLVRLTYRHLPLENLHPNAKKAAEASECANDQGGFWDYHDKLFTEFDNWSGLTSETLIPELSKYATELGLDGQTLTSCLDSDKYTEKVDNDIADATTAGATGTPTFFINGKILVGALPFQTFKTLLDKELQN